VSATRKRLSNFWINRLQRADSTVLSQRNVYILPTRAGLMLCMTLLILLLASINFQLNLGYMLTFLITGSALAGMHIGHANLRGLQLQLIAPQPGFAGNPARLEIVLESTRSSPRYGLGLALLGHAQWIWVDVAGNSSVRTSVQFLPPHRGLVEIPPLTAETRYPLGSFRVWTIWRPASRLLVYPQPENHAPPLPAQMADTGIGQAATARGRASSDYDGVRSYRHGDPLKMVLWKKMAKSGQLISRDSPAAQLHALWLDWSMCACADPESKLSRLCAWVIQAEHLQLLYGLRMPGQEIPPDMGPAHRQACLQALALYQQAA